MDFSIVYWKGTRVLVRYKKSPFFGTRRKCLLKRALDQAAGHTKMNICLDIHFCGPGECTSRRCLGVDLFISHHPLLLVNI